MSNNVNSTSSAQTDHTPDDKDLRLTEILEGHLADLERGAATDRHTLLARHPELTEQLTSCLDSLELARRIGTQLSDGGSGNPAPSSTNVPMQLGDFRIVRELGRGGMGVVYEAEQLSVGRQVALKILPLAAMLDPKGLARFKNEVRAAATLDHPHIVPIYSVGEERGVHYFAMQLIRGQSMARVIEQLRLAGPLCGASSIAEAVRDANQGAAKTPCHDNTKTPLMDAETRAQSGASTPAERAGETAAEPKPRHCDFCRTVARLGIQAANALHDAHEHGVVHRDVKPGNLLVDNSEKLWVTDFGLARIESDAGMTLSRDYVGTLRYMAPEQALGKRGRVDHRADVYSLGATLYELLVQRPAREGDDRQEMLKQLASTLPTPVSKIDPCIPGDLATIIGKAMELEPSDRYATAKELGDDLGRYLSDEPIEAKSATLPQRVAKWTRRHRAVTWSASLSAVVVLVIAVVLLAIGNVMITNERDQKDLALQGQKESLEEKETGLQIAFHVLNKICLMIIHKRSLSEDTERLSMEDWGKTVGVLRSGTPLADDEQRILDAVLEFYQTISDEHGQDPQIRFARAEAQYTITEIYIGLGHPEKELAAHRSSVALLETLVSEFPDDSKYRLWLHKTRGNLRLKQREWDSAIDDFTEQIKIDATDGGARMLRGLAYYESGRRQKAEEEFTRAIELDPNNAVAWSNRGNVYFELREWEKALRDFKQAVTLVPLDPYVNHFLGLVLFEMGQFEKAVSSLTRSIELDPNHSEKFVDRGQAYQETGHLEKATADYSRAIELAPGRHDAWCNRATCALLSDQFQQSIDDYSEALARQPDTILAIHNRGIAYMEMGQFDKALADLSREIELTPVSARAFASRGDCNAGQQKWEEALADFSRAIELNPKSTRGWFGRGDVYWRLKQKDAAIQDLSRAIELGTDNSEAWYLRGRILFDLGKWEAARDDFSRAVEFDPGEQRHWAYLGSAHYRTGDHRSAIVPLEKAITLPLERARNIVPESFVHAAIYLAMAHWQLGEKEIAREWYQKGVDRLKEDTAPRPERLRLRDEAHQLMGMESSD